MSDIVERLDGTQPMTGSLEDMLHEAKDEIARLTAEKEQLRGMLTDANTRLQEKLRVVLMHVIDLRQQIEDDKNERTPDRRSK